MHFLNTGPTILQPQEMPFPGDCQKSCQQSQSELGGQDEQEFGQSQNSTSLDILLSQTADANNFTGLDLHQSL